MQTVNFTILRTNLKKYCEMATKEDEIIVIKRTDGHNVYMIGDSRYEQMVNAYNYLRSGKDINQISFSKQETGSYKPPSYIPIINEVKEPK